MHIVLFHLVVQLTQVRYLVVNVFGLHEVAEEQTPNVVVLHSAALRQVTKHLVNTHLVAALTDVTHVREELLSDVTNNHSHTNSLTVSPLEVYNSVSN